MDQVRDKILPELRVVQQNLCRSREGAAEFGRRAANLDVDVALLQETYVYKGHTVGIGVRARIFEVAPALATIVVFNPDLCVTFLTSLSDSWRAVVHIAAPGFDLVLVSAYFQYSHPIGPHIQGLELTVEKLKKQNIIIGADLNAHSPLWGDHSDERAARKPDRNKTVVDFIVGSGLSVAADDRGPSVHTFSSPNGESTPDATLFGLGNRFQLKHWRVHPDWNISDHRLISFVVTPNNRSSSTDQTKEARISSLLPRRFKTKKADWESFVFELQTKLDEEAKRLNTDTPINTKAEALSRALREAAEATIPRCKPHSEKRGKQQPSWWSSEIEAARKTANRTRRKWIKRKAITQDGNDCALEEAKKCAKNARNKYKSLIRREKRSKWREFVTKECEDNTWGTHYRAIKATNGANSSPADIRNKNGIGSVNSVEAASNILEAMFPSDPPLADSKYQSRIRKKAASIENEPAATNYSPISSAELESAFKKLKSRASPGLDCVNREIIKQAWPAVNPALRVVLSEALETGTFPDCWKLGKLIILAKPGNNKSRMDPKAYRPITLLPAVGKLFEKIIAARIESHLKIEAPLSERQFGFRPGKSTDDAILFTKTAVDALPGKLVVGVLLDITGAFDHAWWPKIITSLQERRVPVELIKTIASYFENRSVCIDAGSELVWRALRRGCPQGSVLGPLLWNILFDDVLSSRLPPHCELVAYADDLLLLASADSRAKVESKTESALNTIAAWGEKNKLTFAPQKTTAIILRGKLDERRPPIIRMNEQKIKFETNARYLGLILAKNFNVSTHLRTASNKARCALGKLARLGGKTWGLNFRAKVTMYKCIYVSIVTYAASAWAEKAARGAPQLILLRSQSAPLRFLTAGYATAPVAAMSVLAGVEPIDLVAQARAAVFHMRRGCSAFIAGAECHPPEGHETPSATLLAIRRLTRAHVIDEWQRRWNESTTGLLTKKFLPSVSERVNKKWFRCSYWTTQFFTGHGAFRAYLHRFGFEEDPKCPCGEESQTSEHILWDCPLLDEERADLHERLVLTGDGAAEHRDLTASSNNLSAFERFCRAYGEKPGVRPA